MKVLVTGSAGHLGEALVRTLSNQGHEVVGLDILATPFTTRVGSIADRPFVRRCMTDIETVFHTATLHKPHVATHSRQDFVNINILGTLNLLEEATNEGVRSFIYSSTTSVFGDALTPAAGAPAAWVTEDLTPIPKNIYGVTKAAAEDLCALFHRNHGLACVVLRTSRFFPEEDDDGGVLASYADDNIKLNEYLYRRVDIEDAVNAQLLAAERAPAIGFGRYIISATTPFTRDDLPDLRTNAPLVVRRRSPSHEAEYNRRGWKIPPSLGRVYVNELARRELGWRPVHDFESVVDRLKAGGRIQSALAELIGSKGYHGGSFAEGPSPAG